MGPLGCGRKRMSIPVSAQTKKTSGLFCHNTPGSQFDYELVLFQMPAAVNQILSALNYVQQQFT
jgi:hypothetical protein